MTFWIGEPLELPGILYFAQDCAFYIEMIITIYPELLDERGALILNNWGKTIGDIYSVTGKVRVWTSVITRVT